MKKNICNKNNTALDTNSKKIVMNKQTSYFVIGLIIFLFGLIIWVTIQRKQLQKHHSITHGKIIDCNWGGNGNTVFYIDYEFFLNHKLYKSSSALRCNNFKTSVLKQKLIGLEVPVVYDPDKPSLNDMVIERETFNLYNIPIPDSLVAIADFLHCK